MTAKTAAPRKTPPKPAAAQPKPETKDDPTTEQDKPEQDSPTPEADESNHPAAEGIPLPLDPSAVRLQEEQDELQQPGRVAKAVADQVDNDPGYSKDQLAHMKEYWSHDADDADDE